MTEHRDYQSAYSAARTPEMLALPMTRREIEGYAEASTTVQGRHYSARHPFYTPRSASTDEMAFEMCEHKLRMKLAREQETDK